jgi:hypothetical protein
VLLALWSEFGPQRWKKKHPSQLAIGKSPSHHGTAPVPMALPADGSVPMAEGIPVAEVVEAPSAPPRRIGTASHLRSLTLQERLQVLLGQLSALMDSKDEEDWTVNPAYHPEVNAYIAQYGNFPQFIARARALQKNRAPYYGKMVVPGVRRKTILATGRSTQVE